MNILNKIEDLYLRNPESFLLIEIGANDGKMADRMHDFVLKNNPISVMIEPLPDYFSELQNNYKHLCNVNYENVAISNKNGFEVMTYIPKKRIKNKEVRFRMEGSSDNELQNHWAGGLGSLYKDKNNLACPELKEFQEEVEVKTSRIIDVLKKYNADSFENIVIQTDCEGHDVVVLEDFPFDYIKPDIYISEISFNALRWPKNHPKHGTNSGLYSKSEYNKARDIFLKNGYELIQKNDLIAINKTNSF